MIKRAGYVVATLSMLTAAAVAEPVGDCKQGRNPAIRMQACTEVIRGAGFSADEKAAAYRHRGNARADAGAGEQAVSDLTEAIRLAPGNAAAHADRGRARLGLRNLEAAISDYSEALRLAPGSAPFHIGRGHAHLVKGNVDLAIADFTQAIRLNPNSASALNRRGLAYRKKGDLTRAIDDYTAAIMLNPIYALAYNNRGYAYEAQGRKDDAIADFQVALLLDPSLVGAKDGLQRLGAPAGYLAESERRVREGKALVEKTCSGCHAVGPRGSSPNRKAPEFRNLHERHAMLALREPLSRGIAAPHDEMPKFSLNSAQIDAIVAYINSLTPPRPNPAGWKAAIVPIADEQDLGDASKGLAYAQRVCAQCHAVTRNQRVSPDANAPTFKAVADTPGMTATALVVFFRTPHRTMPNLVVEPDAMDDLIAYVLSLKSKK
jgi:tetratricopeptide (TPR) repeat protein